MYLPVEVLEIDPEHVPLAVALGRVLPAEQVSVVLPELEDVQQVKVGVVGPVPVPAILLSPSYIQKSY